jgi:hypothetical protein
VCCPFAAHPAASPHVPCQPPLAETAPARQLHRMPVSSKP